MPHRPAVTSCRLQRGLSLVEAAIVLAIAAIVVGVALPSFDQSRQRRHLEGAATLFETDLHHARSLAVARHQTVRITFDATSGAVCYVVHTGAAGACTCGAEGPAACAPGAEALRTARLEGARAPTVDSNVRSMAIDPVRGTVTPTGTVRFRAPNGMAIHQVVNIIGRVRSCAPAPGLPGYRTC
jgi:type IV fimbrial biogenesis protein FimT